MWTNCVAKLAKWPSFSTLTFYHWLYYCNMDKQLYGIDDPSTSCTNIVHFGTATPAIEVDEFCTFETILQKLAYLTVYLNNYWTDLHQHFSFGRGMYVDYKTGISFTLLQGRCYGNQLILGDICRCQNWQSSLIALVNWKEMHHRLADMCINSRTNCYTSCEKMMKIDLVVFELKWGRKLKLCCDTAKISRFSFIWHTGIRKWIVMSISILAL